MAMVKRFYENCFYEAYHAEMKERGLDPCLDHGITSGAFDLPEEASSELDRAIYARYQKLVKEREREYARPPEGDC